MTWRSCSKKSANHVTVASATGCDCSRASTASCIKNFTRASRTALLDSMTSSCRFTSASSASTTTAAAWDFCLASAAS
ncbi:hypothetical protein FIBSPDRAFT_859093 [Athelia psychrophila]|uniref:Uncharacterized protein n=1 Tax=Athelia psychrophila TaxID=1759441 RepID=A0A166LE37_9AGAM|nr:hypothetical protein FIBSPDRAFT_859093 [Fibularhizoctonia sp. CBS 109695]